MALRGAPEAYAGIHHRGRLADRRAPGAKRSPSFAADRAALLWILLCALGLLALAGCGAAARGLPCAEDRHCLRYAITRDIPVLDPHLSDLPEAGMILRQLYDTLIYRDPESHEFLPGLARDWQVSPDGLAYTFHLRQDIVFHDGGAFAAAAVARNLERIFHPDTASSKARELLGPLRQFEILDEFTIRLRLFTPYAALLDGLAQPYLGIASPAALERYDDLRFQYHQSGTGPFMLEDYLPGERVVLRRFEGYRVNAYAGGGADEDAISRIVISIVDESDADLLSLLGDAYDVIDEISPAAAQILAGDSGAQLLPIAIPGQSVQFVFNTKRRHLQDRALRLALLLASNRIAIIDQVFFNTSPLAWMPLSGSTGFAHTGFVGAFDHDLVRAQEALAAAGYADSDRDGVLEQAGFPLSLTMLVPPWGRLPEVAALLREQWRRIGIDLRLAPAAGNSQLRTMIQTGQYDLLPVDNYGIDPGILGRVFLEGSPYSASRAQDPALNDLLLAAAQERDPARRRRLYYEIQSLLMNEALLLPIREYARLRALSANVDRLRYDAYGFYPLFSSVAISGD